MMTHCQAQGIGGLSIFRAQLGEAQNASFSKVEEIWGWGVGDVSRGQEKRERFGERQISWWLQNIG